MYDFGMPKLWTETIEKHRHEVREAIMDTAWALAVEHGPMGVTMSQVAQETGIGRATLYKYFSDVESILHAKHEDHVHAHLRRLRALSAQTSDPGERLRVVAEAFADICRHRGQHGSVELSMLTHQSDRVAGPEEQVLLLFEGCLAGAVAVGAVRADTVVEELALYCVHALGAAASMSSKAAARRLVAVTLGALTPPVA